MIPSLVSTTVNQTDVMAIPHALVLRNCVDMGFLVFLSSETVFCGHFKNIFWEIHIACARFDQDSASGD